MKRMLPAILFFVAVVMVASGWPEAKHIEVRPGSMLGWDNASATWRPVAIDPLTGAIGVDAELNVGSMSIEIPPTFVDASDDPTPGKLDANQRVLVNIGSDSIGLMGKLNELLTAAASETVLISAVGAVGETLNAGIKTELATDSIGLIDALDAIAVANASETALLAAINTVKTAVEAVELTTEASFNDGTDDQKGLVDASRRIVTSIGHDGIGLVDAIQAMPNEIDSRKVSLTADTAQNISSTLTGDRLYIEITTMSDDAEIWVDFDTPAVIGESRRVVGGIGIKLPKATAVSVIASESIDIFVLEGGK